MKTIGTDSVDWAVNGTGTNPANAADFGGSFPSGTLSFADGDTSKTITVNVAGDATNEQDETFTVTLSNPSNSGSITTATSTGTIQNDDAAPQLASPSGVTVTISGTVVSADWADVVDATAYEWEIHNSATPGTGTLVANSANTLSQMVVTTLTPGPTYYLRVKAEASGFADSNWSAMVAFGGTQLPAPASIAFSSVTSNGFTASWTPASNANEMDYEVSTNSGFTAVIASGSGSNSGSFNFSSGTSGHQYWVRVRQRSNPTWYATSNWTSSSQTLP